MVFLKVIFTKGLQLYLKYFYFKGVQFLKVNLKVVSKILRESSVNQSFLEMFTIKILIIAIIVRNFCFTFGKSRFANKHYYL